MLLSLALASAQSNQIGVPGSCVSAATCTDAALLDPLPASDVPFVSSPSDGDRPCFGLCAKVGGSITDDEDDDEGFPSCDYFSKHHLASKIPLGLYDMRLGNGRDVTSFEDVGVSGFIWTIHAYSVGNTLQKGCSREEFVYDNECDDDDGYTGVILPNNTFVECEDPTSGPCPGPSGMPTVAMFSTNPDNAPGSPLSGVQNFDVDVRYDAINTQGSDFLVDGDTPRRGAFRSLATFTNNGPGPIKAYITMETLVDGIHNNIVNSDDHHWIVERSSTSDSPRDLEEFSLSDKDNWFLLRSERPYNNYPAVLVSTQGSCDTDADMVMQDAENVCKHCCYDTDSDDDDQTRIASQFLVDFEDGETKTLAAVVELFLSAAATDESPDDFLGLRLASQVGDRLNRDYSTSKSCGFEPEWFADLTFEERSRIANFVVPAAVRGDVHLKGFNGYEFAVYGLNKRWHSLYSDANVQVNVKLEFPREKNTDWTGSVIKEVAIMTGDEWRFHYDALRSDSPQTSGVVLPRAEALPSGGYRFGECGSITWSSPFSLSALVGGYNITITRNEWAGKSGSTENFLDVIVDVPGATDEASGFLGDTWTTRGTDKRPLRSTNDADYLVEGPFGHDDSFNAFNPEAGEDFWVQNSAAVANKCGAIKALYSQNRRSAASVDAETQPE